MNQIAAKYTAKGEGNATVLQDFNTFRQALNVASADQRLLVFVNPGKNKQDTTEEKLKEVFSDDAVVGKFHLNFFDKEVDGDWTKAIEGEKNRPGIIIIRAGAFGVDGTVMNQLALTATTNEIKTAMLDANQKLATVEKRKTYGQHVQIGRRQRIYFENEIPYGEDRDGDGEIDGRRSKNKR